MLKYIGFSYERASRRIQDIVDKCAKSGACTDDDIAELYELRSVRIVENMRPKAPE